MATQQPIGDARNAILQRGGQCVWKINGDMGIVEVWQVQGRMLWLHKMPSRAGLEVLEALPLDEKDWIETVLDGVKSGGTLD